MDGYPRIGLRQSDLAGRACRDEAGSGAHEWNTLGTGGRQMNFASQTAIVTGGAQGIGLACARRIAECGGTIAVWDIEQDLAESEARALGNGSFACFADVGDWSSVQQALERTLALPCSVI